MTRRRLMAIMVASIASSCSLDWDALDPRIAASSTGGTFSASTSTSISASSGGGPSTASTGSLAAGGTGGGVVHTVIYVATIADCIDPTAAMPDPDTCEADTAPNNFKVDLADAVTGEPSYGYVRFDLDETLEGREVLSATLRLTTTDDQHAPGVTTGVLWEVAPFTRPELYLAAPPPVGSAPIALDMGPIDANATVDYVLPLSLVHPSSGLFLSLVPTHDDGVNYWNTQGLAPPVVIVDYR